jgi:hypothetical protein
MLNPRAFREVVRSVTVSYPVPFIFAAMLAFALACLGGALAAGGALRWLLAAIGSLFAAAALFVVLYAILREPRLLRSERFELAHRMLDLIGDNEVDQVIRKGLLAGPLSKELGESVSKREGADQDGSESGAGAEEDNG